MHSSAGPRSGCGTPEPWQVTVRGHLEAALDAIPADEQHGRLAEAVARAQAHAPECAIDHARARPAEHDERLTEELRRAADFLHRQGCGDAAVAVDRAVEKLSQGAAWKFGSQYRAVSGRETCAPRVQRRRDGRRKRRSYRRGTTRADDHAPRRSDSTRTRTRIQEERCRDTRSLRGTDDASDDMASCTTFAAANAAARVARPGAAAAPDHPRTPSVVCGGLPDPARTPAQRSPT